MLRIIYGRTQDENVVRATSNYFNKNYKNEWFLDSFVKQIMMEIDNVTFKDGKLINRVGDEITPKVLSGSVKVLIAMYHNPSVIFDISACSDNCSHLLLELGKRRSVTANLLHKLNLEGDFTVEIVNCNKIVHNKEEYLDAILPYIK